MIHITVIYHVCITRSCTSVVIEAMELNLITTRNCLFCCHTITSKCRRNNTLYLIDRSIYLYIGIDTPRECVYIILCLDIGLLAHLDDIRRASNDTLIIKINSPEFDTGSVHLLKDTEFHILVASECLFYLVARQCARKNKAFPLVHVEVAAYVVSNGVFIMVIIIRIAVDATWSVGTIAVRGYFKIRGACFRSIEIPLLVSHIEKLEIVKKGITSLVGSLASTDVESTRL